jgi:hypothetical protein
MTNKKPAKTTAITPYVPSLLSAVSFKDIKARQVIRDVTDAQRITKGDNYFHHVKSGLNYTYNGFSDDKNLCVVDPKSGLNVTVSESLLIKEFKFAGPATLKGLKK